MFSSCPHALPTPHRCYDGSVEGCGGYGVHASKILQSSFFLDKKNFLKASLFCKAVSEFSMECAFI